MGIALREKEGQHGHRHAPHASDTAQLVTSNLPELSNWGLNGSNTPALSQHAAADLDRLALSVQEQHLPTSNGATAAVRWLSAAGGWGMLLRSHVRCIQQAGVPCASRSCPAGRHPAPRCGCHPPARRRATATPCCPRLPPPAASARALGLRRRSIQSLTARQPRPSTGARPEPLQAAWHPPHPPRPRLRLPCPPRSRHAAPPTSGPLTQLPINGRCKDQATS